MTSLLRVRRESEALKQQITALPPLPKFPGGKNPDPPARAASSLQLNPIWVQVRGRPVGKVETIDGSLRFQATPFRFFTKRRP